MKGGDRLILDRYGNPLRTIRRRSPLDVEDYHDDTTVHYSLAAEPEMMTQVSWVYACITAIARAIKLTPLRTYEGEDGDEEIKGGPLYKLMKNPNPMYSFRKILEGTAVWLESRGNAYWWLEGATENGGEPENIWLLSPEHMFVVGDKTRYIKGYVHELGGQRKPLSIYEVIHFRLFNPFDPFYGLGTMQAAAATLLAEKYRRDYERSFFKNGARLSGILWTPERLDDDVYNRVVDDWKRMHQGAKNAHKTAILEQGLQYQPLTVSQKDMEFIEMARWNRDEILAIFGVTPAILGLVEDANRANSRTQDITFWRNIKSKLTDIEDTINNHPTIQTMTPERVRFDEVVKEDETAKVRQVVELAKVGILDVNELRERLGYKPIRGNTNTGANGEQEEDTERQETPMIRALHDRLQITRDESIDEFIQKFTPEIQTFFDEQELRVLRRLRRNGELIERASIEQIVEALLSAIWVERTENQKIRELLMPIHIEVAREAYDTASAGFFDSDKRWSMDNENHQRIINSLARKVKRINETTREAIREQIREGLERGYSVDQIAQGVPDEEYKGIAGVFEEARGSRARTIARSETADAYNMANLQSYEDNEIKKVVVIDGTDYDEDCRRANGSIWTIEKARKNPKEHPNCTRAFAPYFDFERNSREEVIDRIWQIIKRLG